MSFTLSRLLSLSHRRARFWSKTHPGLLSNHTFKRSIQEFPPTRIQNAAHEDHFIVLAERLNDKDNELLRIPKIGENEINFNKIDPEIAFKGLSEALCAFEDYVTDIESTDKCPYESLEELFKDIEKNLYPLDCAYNLLMVKLCVGSENYSLKEINVLLNRYYECRNKRFQGLFDDYFKELSQKSDTSKLDQADLRLAHVYKENLSQEKLRALDESTLFELRSNLRKDEIIFLHCIRGGNSLISHTVDDPDILAAVASEYADCESLHHKERTPLRVTASTYQKFMKVCPDAFVRRMLWETYNKRCSPKALPRLNTTSYQTSIRVNRRKVAEIRGYRSHLDFRLRDTMAKTKSNIITSLRAIQEDNEPKMYDRLEELNEFARDNQPSSVQADIGEQDVDYWSYRYTHDVLIGVDRSRLTSFFPLKNVTQGIRQYLKDYMSIDISINEEKKTKRGLWSSRCQLWQLKREGDLLGNIIFDPFRHGERPSPDALYARIRTKFSAPYDTQTTRLISAPYTIDPNTNEAHLNITDLMVLFNCFTIVVQRLMYNHKYYELNTIGALEKDAMNLFPHLCKAHLLRNHSILQSMSVRDINNSKPIDAELASRILKAVHYFRPLRIWNELYRARLDCELYSVMTNMKDLAEETYKIYSPYERFVDNYDYCAMQDIFVGPNDGTKYADLWSRQLASACLGQIEDVDGNLSDDKMKEFYNKLIPTLFDGNNLGTHSKLVSLFADTAGEGGFEFTKSGLGVL